MFELAEWQRQAGALKFPDRAVINGQHCAAQSGQTFAAINPATGQLLANVAACGGADVDAAVRNARHVFEAGIWAQRPPAERKQVLLRLAELLMEHRQELALLDSLNMGKPVMDAYNIDVPGAAGVFRWYAESIDKLYDQIAPGAVNVLATITREALGVVAAVVPWNFPLDMAAWKLAPALAAGNSVILKPAEQSPFSALRLAELALEAGLPPGVLNVLPGLGEQTGKALGLHADVDHRLDAGRQIFHAVLGAIQPQTSVAGVRRQECQSGVRRLPGSGPGGGKSRVRDLLQSGRSVFGQLATVGRAFDS